jgi:type IV secretion system protein VirD4
MKRPMNNWIILTLALLAFALICVLGSASKTRKITKGVRIGFSQSGKVLHYPGSGHLITVAPTRVGKGRDILIPGLLEWPESVICIDPKGELAAVTGHYRQRFGDVLILNPFNFWSKHLAGLTPARYNPMSNLNPAERSFGADADKIADAIVYHQGPGEESHWSTSAQLLVSGGIMALAKHGGPHEKNLGMLRQVISGGRLFDFCRKAMRSNDPFIRQKLARFAAKGAIENKEINGIISTADNQTGFIGNLAITESLSASDFRFRDLKRKATTVYVVLPLDYLDVCSKWFRLIIAAALSELLHEEKGVRVLVVMDEFAQLGPLKAIQNAMGMAAGFGLTLWPVLQDLNQLSGLYPNTWETFLSNAGVRMFFGPRDEKTSHYLSGQCGQTERRTVAKSISEQQGQTQINLSYGQVGVPLMDAYSTRQLDEDEMLLFIERVKGVVKAKRRPYWCDFKGYGRNPYFG